VTPAARETVLAAIDVGTNAVRLEMARPLPDGSLETLHQERDAVRPGEGIFTTGAMTPAAVDRLLSTLRRYSALCRRHGAKVRAVATSAVREAKNRDEIVRRVRREAGLLLEVISGKEEARLTFLGVLQGNPPATRSLCIDIGGGSTELAAAVGHRPQDLWSVTLGALRLAELFDARGNVGPKQLKLMRGYAREALTEALPKRVPGFPRVALGSSGSCRAVIGFAAAPGTGHATLRQLSRAVDALVDLGADGRRKRFEPGRADIIVAGAVILEAVAQHLSLESVTAVERGLRHGVLVDLVRRTSRTARDPSLADAVVTLGRHLYFDEGHARQVARLALTLFDELASVHRLPALVRPFLETAALLHDIGNAVNYQKHHRHTQYLIQNADIPGLADRERDLVARIARYHRRSPPDLHHAGMLGLSQSEARMVRKLATLLRVADSLDRSHLQPVTRLRVTRRNRDVVLRLEGRAPTDLELWDVAHEALLFSRVFGPRLRVEAARR
jgi:exopolyphosphatase / guanosine-5'-triphosphate,3'-diphosphate pyrophosphatase